MVRFTDRWKMGEAAGRSEKSQAEDSHCWMEVLLENEKHPTGYTCKTEDIQLCRLV